MGTASAVTPARASGRANTASTAASTAPVERKDSARGSDCHGLSAASARLWNRRWAAASARASAPWKLKIDCFSSPTAKRVRGAARAPSPAKNSSASAAITAHWVGARVLRLVDQQVIEAAVELVEHPGCDARAGQQAPADRDLIAVVEHGMTLFLGPVEAEMAGRDLDKGGAALGHAGGVPAFDDHADPLLL